MANTIDTVPGEPYHFTQGGVHFVLDPLPSEVSLLGLDLLQQSLIPVLDDVLHVLTKIDWKALGKIDLESEAEIIKFLETCGVNESEILGVVKRALGTAKHLPALYKLFAPNCYVIVGPAKVRVCDSTTAFARRSAALIAWVIECLRIEYADFLDGTGTKLIWKALSSWKFQEESDQ